MFLYVYKIILYVYLKQNKYEQKSVSLRLKNYHEWGLLFLFEKSMGYTRASSLESRGKNRKTTYEKIWLQQLWSWKESGIRCFTGSSD